MTTLGNGALAIDTAALDRLKSQAARDPRTSLRAAATQFEAVFANMLLKSMREAVPQGDPLASDATRMYTGMLDQQLAQSLAGKGLGLADMVVKQLERYVGAANAERGAGEQARGVKDSAARGSADPARAPASASRADAGDASNRGARSISPVQSAIQGASSLLQRPWSWPAQLASPSAPQSVTQATVRSASQPASVASAQSASQPASQSAQQTPSAVATSAASSAPQSFVDSMAAHAQEAERATGIPARFALAQAALESGWGRREIRGADGAASFNVFGIKAGKGWTGRTVDVLTTEFVDGIARKVVQKFRAYESYAEAFTDWARLLKGNPRYAQALAAGDDPARFAQSLQSAGYATDPAYAAKLTRVLNHALLRQTIA